jgi:RNA polymerase sigma-70 factor, ECF subfamily
VGRYSGVISHIGSVSAHGDRADEEQLIDRCRRGDRSAFNPLVVRHYASIYSVARRLLACPDDAADVAQEVFIAAWKQLPRFSPRASFRTWLYAITVRQCALSARGARRRPASLEIRDLPGPVIDGEAPVHAMFERHELEAALHAAVHSLPRAHREALVLHYFGDLTCEETAAVMGTSSGTVKTHLFRARKSLRDALKGQIDEEAL